MTGTQQMLIHSMLIPIYLAFDFFTYKKEKEKEVILLVSFGFPNMYCTKDK